MTWLSGFYQYKTLVRSKLNVGLSATELNALQYLRRNELNQIVDGDGIVISGSPSVDTQAELWALDAADYEGFVIVCKELNNAAFISDGVNFGPLNGQYIEDWGVTPDVIAIWPNNVTWTAASTGGGTPKVRLTTGANAAHGLTTTPAVGASLYVKSGTNWTANSWHEITAVDDTSGVRTVDLNTTWASQGAPTIAYAGTVEANSEVILKEWSLPVLRPVSAVIADYEVSFTSNANAKRIKFYLESTELNNQNTTAANLNVPFKHGFRNQNLTTHQKGIAAYNSTGLTGNTIAVIDRPAGVGEIDTGVAGKKASIRAMLEAANITARIAGYDLIIRR